MPQCSFPLDFHFQRAEVLAESHVVALIHGAHLVDLELEGALVCRVEVGAALLVRTLLIFHSFLDSL